LRPDLRRLAGTPFEALVGEGAPRLAPVFTTTFERTTLPLVLPDGTRAELAVDRGEVRGGARDTPSAPSEPISEVEIELRDGRPAALFALALAIADDIPVLVQSRSKAERGYALAGRLVPVPVRAERPEHAPSATAGEAIATLLRSALRQIEANAAGMATGADPEWVHQMRVGVRRLRAVLSQARNVLPRGEARRLNGALRALAQSLAPVRDLDVFLGETLPSIEAVRRASVGETRALARLREAAVARREAAHAFAAETVASPAVQRTLLEVAALAASAVRDADAKAARRLAAPAKAFAADVLSRRHRRLVARAADPERMTADERHALRIAAKKLRYAADGFATLFPARRTKAYRDALATLQDVLGTLNDAFVAANLAASLDAPHGAAVRIVTRWDASRRAQQQADLRHAWRAFRRARRFWMDE
jgi:inorganic triphosphatase YgiF